MYEMYIYIDTYFILKQNIYYTIEYNRIYFTK